MDGGEGLSGSKRNAALYGISFLSKQVTNISASIRQRLLNLARTRNEDFGLLLTKYALERILYRISQSKYRTVFVLKGALLFELWTDQAHRPTRDADFLSQGENDPERHGAQVFAAEADRQTVRGRVLFRCKRRVDARR